MQRMASLSLAPHLGVGAGLLLAVALPLGAQTWFEIEREPPPAGHWSAGETLMEADLNTLRPEPANPSIEVRVSWAQPRPIGSGPAARSVQALVEVSCPAGLLRWGQPRFFSERQAQGVELALPAEAARALQATDWLPPGGQAKLVRSTCGRIRLRPP